MTLSLHSSGQQLMLENITTSESQLLPSPHPAVRGLTHIDFSCNRAGDIAEIYATAALMARGATVFRNTGCDGRTDLCFKYKGKVIEVDVKLARYMHDGRGNWRWRSNNAGQVELPVYPLIVVPRTGADLSGWYCKWNGKPGGGKEYNCPPGLETFWD